MPGKSSNLGQFWQELKRRKVLRVITVYAAVAFVILQLVEILAPSLRLPEWTMNLILVLLIVGFIIAVILSWIYDIHPEGGIVKTEPGDKVKADDISKSSKGWKITSYISFVVIIAIILIAVIKPFSSFGRAKDLTIMVLPLLNDSPGEGDDYIVNGLMEEILNKLTLIEELDVRSRTTSEKYRDSPKSSKEIAHEVGVQYILEGSAQTVFDITRIRLQLIEADHDRHLWAKPYEREIRLENLFDVLEELSQIVADELEIVLNLREKEQIEKKPTENLAAFEAYLQATDLLFAAQYLTGSEQNIKVQDARRLLEGALGLDSCFTDAYTSLGSIYINTLFKMGLRNNAERAYSNLESGLAYAEKALQYDPENQAAMRLKGSYYQRIGNHNEAEQYVEASFKNRTMSYVDYEWETLNFLEYDNFYSGIKSYLNYLELKPPDVDVPLEMLNAVFKAYTSTGFFELGQEHVEQHLALTQDYDNYYWRMSWLERWQGNHGAAQEYSYKWWELDTSSMASFEWIKVNYIFLNEVDSAYKYMRLIEDDRKEKGRDISPSLTSGWIYLERGLKSEADFHLLGSISELKKEVELKTPDSQKGYTHLLLGMAYSLLGDDTNSIKHLEYLKKVSAADIGWIMTLKHFFSIDYFPNTPEFQSVLKHMEKVYRKEHKRIARLLRQQGYPST